MLFDRCRALRYQQAVVHYVKRKPLPSAPTAPSMPAAGTSFDGFDEGGDQASGLVPVAFPL